MLQYMKLSELDTYNIGTRDYGCKQTNSKGAAQGQSLFTAL